MEGMPTLNKRYNQETTQVEQEESHWYALKVFFNKVFDVEETLNGCGISTYIPCETQGNGHERKPMINSLIFFRSAPAFAQRVNTLLYNKAFVYTSSTDMGKKPYAIPEKEMNIFMLVCSSGESGLEYFGADDSFFRKRQHEYILHHSTLRKRTKQTKRYWTNYRIVMDKTLDKRCIDGNIL